MALIKHRNKPSLGMLLLSLGASLSLAYAADENLTSMSLVEFAEKYKDSDATKLRELAVDIQIQQKLASSSTAKEELRIKAKEVARLRAKDSYSEYLDASLGDGLGTTDASEVRKSLHSKIDGMIKTAALDKDTLPEGEDAARKEKQSMGERSPFDLQLSSWKDKDGKLHFKTEVVPKAGFMDSEKVKSVGLTEMKKYFKPEEIEEITREFSKDAGSHSFKLDPASTDFNKDVEAQLAKTKAKWNGKDDDYLKSQVKRGAELREQLGESLKELGKLEEEKDPARAKARLAQMDKVLNTIKAGKDKALEPCALVEKVVHKSAMSDADREKCFPVETEKAKVAAAGHGEEEGEKPARRRAAKDPDGEDGIGGDLAAKGEGDNKAPPMPPQMDPSQMQLAMQREANAAACLNANQQLMAAAPQRALDDKFNSLLQGFESVVSGSTLLPQVLVSIPPDLSGPGAFLQAQNAVEDLTKDWSLNDTETHAKVKKELRAAEMAASKAAADYEAYRFRLSRVGLLNPMFGLPPESPEMVKLAKLERNMAAAGALKESLQAMHSTIRIMTKSSLNGIGGSSSRTSRESLVPAVGNVPRAAPSR